MVANHRYGSFFSFFIPNLYDFLYNAASSILPVVPASYALAFKLFGISDLVVISTSLLYFVLTLIFVFLLAQKVFKSNIIAVLSTFAVGFNQNLVNYATNGASEIPFIFELVAAGYFISIKKKWATLVGILFLILMYFTRQQAFIYIAGIVLYWLLNNFVPRKAFTYFAGILILGLLVDRLVLVPLSGKYFLYSVTESGADVINQYLPGVASSDLLRGSVHDLDILAIGKKIFYNLYNFYKLLPQIINPYLVAFFVIGLFIKTKERLVNSFRISTVFTACITFLATASSIPLFRYLHPIVPFVYIFAVGTIVGLLRLFSTKKLFVSRVSIFLILIFGLLQTFGALVLDTRFERKIHNVGEPPVYVELSRVLKENTNPGQVIITNLDTWGSWYGERKTVWYPLKPEQLARNDWGKFFDAIYLTSYLIDDENYYMGPEWRQIFEDPKNIKDEFIKKTYIFKAEFYIPAEETYERTSAKAVLLVRKPL
jgi:hypothetical protein